LWPVALHWPTLLYNLRAFSALSKCYPNPDIGNCHCERSEAILASFDEIATPAWRNRYSSNAFDGALRRAGLHLAGAHKAGMGKGFYSPNWDLGASNCLFWLFFNTLPKFQQSFVRMSYKENKPIP
jgi:hypothetical protein